VSGQVATAAGRVDIESAEVARVGRASRRQRAGPELLGTPRGEFTISTPRARHPCRAARCSRTGTAGSADLGGAHPGRQIGWWRLPFLSTPRLETSTLDVRVESALHRQDGTAAAGQSDPALLRRRPPARRRPNLPLGKLPPGISPRVGGKWARVHLPAPFSPPEDKPASSGTMAFAHRDDSHALVQDLEILWTFRTRGQHHHASNWPKHCS